MYTVHVTVHVHVHIQCELHMFIILFINSFTLFFIVFLLSRPLRDDEVLPVRTHRVVQQVEEEERPSKKSDKKRHKKSKGKVEYCDEECIYSVEDGVYSPPSKNQL